MRTTILLLVTLVFVPQILGQDSPRQIISSPKIELPPVASESGLGGKLLVKIGVNKAGKVTSVIDVAGPDWVCPATDRSDVTALREAARNLAKQIEFAPSEKDSTESVAIPFPSKPRIADDSPNNDPMPANNGGGATVEKRRNIPKQINGGVMNGRAKSLAKPPYPPEARAARAAGSVTIMVLIDEEGNVFSAEPVGGHQLLLGAARTAACLSKFTPTRLMGSPVRVSGVITYNFVP